MKWPIKNVFLLPTLLVGLGLALPGPAVAQTFTTLHSSTATDGSQPGGLILSANTLYGTTLLGSSAGSGTVFKVNTDGTGFTTLHTFSAIPDIIDQETNSDGAEPTGLILSGNTLYGATAMGGTAGYGTVFTLNTDGTGFQTLYGFAGGPGNQQNSLGPVGLVLSGNTLYGTASVGSWGFGTVFALNTDGTGFTTLYDFSNGGHGAGPGGALLLSSNTLYGTYGISSSNGGTVFALNTDGSGFTTVYEFTAPFPYSYGTNTDGAGPNGGLVLSGNTLYGTTEVGGSGGSGRGFGTVFAVNTDGSGFTNLRSFTYGSDGRIPWYGFIVSSNTLYGTTSTGNNEDGLEPIGGTVFALNTDGTGYTVLHSFAPMSSGSFVNSGGARPQVCALSGNTLYGTTRYGGNSGSGTLFSLPLGPVNPPQLTLTPSGPNVILTWPTNATGFTLQSTTNLGPSAVWTTNTPAPVIVNDQNVVTNPVSGAQQFFRLSQ